MLKGHQISKLGVNLRKFGFVILIFFSFGIMLIGKADNLIVGYVKRIVMDTATPVMNVLSYPLSYFHSFSDGVKELVKLRAENKRLRENNSQLLLLKTKAKKLENENQKLQSLMNYKPLAEAGFVTARLVAESEGSFAKSVIAYTGMPNNTKKGQIVLSDKGVVGRIDLTGLLASRVLLITDINSRVPVKILRNGAKGILEGRNNPTPMLISTPTDDVQLGDILLTSGIAGVFPPDLPVGVIKSIDNNKIKVKPFTDMEYIEYVKIVDYNLEGIIPEEIICSVQEGVKPDGK